MTNGAFRGSASRTLRPCEACLPRWQAQNRPRPFCEDWSRTAPPAVKTELVRTPCLQRLASGETQSIPPVLHPKKFIPKSKSKNSPLPRRRDFAGAVETQAGIAGGASRFRAAAAEAERRRNSVGGPAESGAGSQRGCIAQRGAPTNRGGGAEGARADRVAQRHRMAGRGGGVIWRAQ